MCTAGRCEQDSGSFPFLNGQGDGSLSAVGVAVKWAGSFLRDGVFVSSTSNQAVKTFSLLTSSGSLRIILINKGSMPVQQVRTSLWLCCKPYGIYHLRHLGKSKNRCRSLKPC
jgi:hypothetical protein